MVTVRLCCIKVDCHDVALTDARLHKGHMLVLISPALYSYIMSVQAVYFFQALETWSFPVDCSCSYT